MAEPGPLHRLLLPPRPGPAQLLLGLGALLLPMVAVLLGGPWLVFALVASVTIGVGLGLAWIILLGPQWFAAKPLTACVVLLGCFASLANLELVPRWDVVLRAVVLKRQLEDWWRSGQNGELPTPVYDTGRFRTQVKRGEAGSAAAAWTDPPLQRWTPRGYKDACWLVLRADGTVLVLRKRAEMEAAIDAAQAGDKQQEARPAE